MENDIKLVLGGYGSTGIIFWMSSLDWFLVKKNLVPFALIYF